MKRILALLLAIIMIFTLAACGNNTADDTDGGTTTNTKSSTTGTEETTESTKQPDVTTSATDGIEESTSATEGTQAPTEDTKPTEKPTEPTKPDEPTKPTENTEPTEEPTKPTEPSHKHSYSGKVITPATCTEKGTKTFTCSCGSFYTKSISATGHKWGEWETTKEPTTSSEGVSKRKCSNCSAVENKTIEKLSKAQSYFVGLELVSIDHKSTKYDIDGMNFFDKIYGKNKAVQVGDVITYRIKTSDGKPTNIEFYKMHNCKCEITNDKIIVTITDDRVWEEYSILDLDVLNEKGEKVRYRAQDIIVVQYDRDIVNSVIAEQVIEYYGNRMGMKRLWFPENESIVNDYDYVRIPNNSNWFREVVKIMDGWNKKGYTRFSFEVVFADGWQGCAD